MSRYPRAFERLALSLFGCGAIFAAPACQKSTGPDPATPPAAVDTSGPSAASDAQAPAPDPRAPAPDAAMKPVEADATAPGDASAAPAPSNDAPTVTLLEAGAEPRAALRYEVAPELTESIVLTLATSLEVRMAGQAMPSPLPKTRLTVSAKSSAGASTGETMVALVIDAADLADGEPTSTTPAGTRLTEVIRGMKGLHGDKVLAARGVLRGFRWVLPEDAPAALRPVFEGFQSAMDQMTVPWPAEAVGVGARWKTVQSVAQSGLTLNQELTFDVKRVDGDLVELDFQVTLSGPPGKLSGPLTGGLAADVKKLQGSGKGHLVVSRKKLLPDVLTAQNEIALTLSVEQADGKSRELEVTMKLDLEAARP